MKTKQVVDKLVVENGQSGLTEKPPVVTESQPPMFTFVKAKDLRVSEDLLGEISTIEYNDEPGLVDVNTLAENIGIMGTEATALVQSLRSMGAQFIYVS